MPPSLRKRRTSSESEDFFDENGGVDNDEEYVEGSSNFKS